MCDPCADEPTGRAAAEAQPVGRFPAIRAGTNDILLAVFLTISPTRETWLLLAGDGRSTVKSAKPNQNHSKASL